MSPPPPLSDEEAVDIALAMSALECAVLCQLSKDKGRQYSVISKRLGVLYSHVQAVAHMLQDAKLAYVAVIPFNGSRLFLNDRGESVRQAVELLTKAKSRG